MVRPICFPNTHLKLFVSNTFSISEQQRPAEVEWSQPRCIGDLPTKRSGHSLTIVKSGMVYLFGGIDARTPAGPNNELYKLDMSNPEAFYWTHVKVSGNTSPPLQIKGDPSLPAATPEPRWRHTATVIDETKILIFGGYRSSMQRLNDVWVLDTAKDNWSQPCPSINRENCLAGEYSRSSTPCPRGAHAAALIGKNLYIFGGYGGEGFSRHDFNDLHMLDIVTFEWKLLHPCSTGKTGMKPSQSPRKVKSAFEDIPAGSASLVSDSNIPEARSGHSLVAAGDYLVLAGGSNATTQLDDVHIFDTKLLKWTFIETASGPERWGPARWNHTAVAVEAVPQFKVFVWGGNTGQSLNATEGNLSTTTTLPSNSSLSLATASASHPANPQFTYSSELLVYEVGSQTWVRPPVVGAIPEARADTQIVYDPNNGQLMFFGGWATHWFGEVFICRVMGIVGPPYSIESICPVRGPLTGNTLCTVNGMHFLTHGRLDSRPSATVRLTSAEGSIDVPGLINDDSTLTFSTPACDKHGPVTTEVRVAVGNKSFTNTFLSFFYFPVSSALQTVAFGPGLLSGNVIDGLAAPFYIQARDASGANRQNGMDEFAVGVYEADIGQSRRGESDHSLPVKVVDLEDGTYQVIFVVPRTSQYIVHVDFLGTFQGVAGPIRGSPFTMWKVVQEGDERLNNLTSLLPKGKTSLPNELTGHSLTQHVKESIGELKDFCNKALTGLRSTYFNGQNDVEPLIRIKEHLKAVDLRRSELDLRIDTCRATLHYSKRKSLKIDRLDNLVASLENASNLWQETQRQAPMTAAAIAPFNKMWSLKIQEGVEQYEQEIEDKVKAFHAMNFWTFSTKTKAARDQIREAERRQLDEKQQLEKTRHLCTVFGFSDDIIKKSADMIETVRIELEEVKKLWAVIEGMQTSLSSAHNQLWAGWDADAFEDEMKSHVKSLKSLHRCTRWSDAYQKTDAMCKEFMSTLPLIRSLRAKEMQPRHWDVLLHKILGPSREQNQSISSAILTTSAIQTMDTMAHTPSTPHFPKTEATTVETSLTAVEQGVVASTTQPEVDLMPTSDEAASSLNNSGCSERKGIINVQIDGASGAPTAVGANDTSNDENPDESSRVLSSKGTLDDSGIVQGEDSGELEVEAGQRLQHLIPHYNSNLTLGDIISLNLLQFAGDIEEMCDQATKEEKMEVQLDNLEERWESITWKMEPYKDTQVPLLKISEEDFEGLENDQLVVQSMSNSRYKAHFESQIDAWQVILGTMNEAINYFQDIQRTWLYLEPLFIGSEEVKQELPEDAFRFAGIDLDVRETLRKTWARKNVMSSCTAEGLSASLERIVQRLELCQKSLKEFLEGRRRQFPRFYFVSEADLLDILSNGSTPHRILVHTPKIYLSTKTLVLAEREAGLENSSDEPPRPLVTKFVSDVGVEEVEFVEPVPLQGKVEVYLQTILESMKTTLFHKFIKSLRRYQEMPRIDWLMHKNPRTGKPSDPAQIVLLSLAVNYVHEVEVAFERMRTGEDPKALTIQYQRQVAQLSDLIRLTQSSDLSKEDRQRVMVCITMDAHSRDIVEMLCREQISDVNSFKWQTQLKHKYRQPPLHASFQTRDRHLRGEIHNERAEVAICDAVLPYDYEYLGNGPRLVITALTDRIYVTATQALNLKMGCAPAGPAGTGKTETTKDLANALAKCCYVFNCSPEMDYMGLGNIFKGLASSGAWGCFDEFNRLVPEVLSVCSVQFKSICDGIKADTSRIMIEGDEIRLDPTCGAFITMNPGYLGRSELPEGLKALFRPMTVMVPDLVLICENMLMAEGFVTAKVLASKFYGLYSLLRELLSKQAHYDWGLRAVKSVLVVAGAFKRQEPDIDESALLMRALRDFNIPKIAREDQIVFNGLLNDLFPNVDPPRKVDMDLENAVHKACGALHFWPDENFKLKVVQLEEMLAIRHCIFIMGPPGAGKSSCWKTLVQARKLRKSITKVVDINPKAVSTEELYGYISMATREWKDGLLSKVMRELGQIPNDNSKWILLDGDLDANWIESMNSVMDDNRMLTLASNERIPLKSHMRMIFEIRDLKYATPATVSRAGILYISSDDGSQWRSLIHCWLTRTFEERMRKTWGCSPEACISAQNVLRGFFDEYCEKSLCWLKFNAKPVLPMVDVNLIQTLLYMLDAYLGPRHVATIYTGEGPATTRGSVCAAVAGPPEYCEAAFVYCCIWAFGSSLTVGDDGIDYKKLFSDWWKSEWRKIKFPSRDTVFDYWLDPDGHTFEPWTKSPYFHSLSYDSRAVLMSQITVPTPETCSLSSWMLPLIRMQRPVMLAGAAGTGKTQLMNDLLAKQNPSLVQSETVNLNFYTTAATLYNNLSLPLEKKVGAQYGPPGNARLIYFMDDLNLPEVDPYNTQSAIALLRQHVEYGHVYDMSKLQQKQILKTQVVACLNPTAGSFHVNPRLQRWFSTFAVGLPGPTSLLTIYQTFLDGHLQYFDSDIKAQGSNIIKAAYGLHQQVANSFRKTAINFHYEFNIRHLSNVFQGLLVAQPAQVKTAEKFVQLWLHESERVYGDRLSSHEDLHKYHSLAQAQAKKLFPTYNLSKYYTAENPAPLVFCHFTETTQSRSYDQVGSLDRLSTTLEETLKEYNESNPAMDLVLFDDALKHVARISRIILNEGGHALLIGVGGSGKQSLARLAAHVCGYSVKQIVISATYGVTDFKEDLKAAYQKAGLREEGVVFLLADNHITNERFLVYVNDLLASGHIPDLFTTEEQESISSSIAPKAKAAGVATDKRTCWEFFIGRVRKYLHVVLAFSPVGDTLRTRARKFPALVNCTVINWFHAWPKEALYSVGRNYLAQIDLGENGDAVTSTKPDLGTPASSMRVTGNVGAARAFRGVIERFLPYSFLVVNEVAKKFLRLERRFVYTTPKSYLELLKLFGLILKQKRAESDNDIKRLTNGLKKLDETTEAVTKIEEDLKIKLEKAEKKKSVAESIAESVAREKAVVEIETEKAREEKEEVTKIQLQVAAKQRDTEVDLARAEPAVVSAMAALDTLNKKDLAECKTMAKPPAGVDDVFAATMILLAGIHPHISLNAKTGKVKDTSWDACKKALLGNIQEYIDMLKEMKVNVDNSKVPAINWKEVRKYLAMEHFTSEIIMSKNSAAAGLCSFVINIVKYYDIIVTIEPKRLALKQADDQLAAANCRLAQVLTKVAELQEKLDTLNTEYTLANREKQEALDSVAKGEQKLNLAQRLTHALSSENDRWTARIQRMTEDKDLLIGDVLLSAAFISYLGPFTKPYRDELLYQHFVPFLVRELQTAVGTVPLSFAPVTSNVGNKNDGNQVQVSPTKTPVQLLVPEAQIAAWNTEGLPADAVSAENGVILTSSVRWPLLIDPQLQGIKWIREKERGRNLQVVRLGQKLLLEKLRAALENGWSLLIENMGETIDAVLAPVIRRAGIKKGKKQFLKVGDIDVEWHPDFRLYLHTKMSNPHFPPEIQAETTLVNFTVTEKGLEDQLLTLVVQKERRDLAELSVQFVEQQNGFKIKMKELEDIILSKLAMAQGDITEDVELIEGLEKTKRVASDIAAKAALALVTQERIKSTSDKYRPVARRAALLFFLLKDLETIHTYYVYSLAAFILVFNRGMDSIPVPSKRVESSMDEEQGDVVNDTHAHLEGQDSLADMEEQHFQSSLNLDFNRTANTGAMDDMENLNVVDMTDEELHNRCSQLIEAITITTFQYVCRGLFDKDKVTVAFLLALRIMVHEGRISIEELEYLTSSKTTADPSPMGSLVEWLPSNVWQRVKALEGLKKYFNHLGDALQSSPDEWRDWFDHEQPEIAKLPSEYERGLPPLARLILLRAFRPDRLITAIKIWISHSLGNDYISQRPFDMTQAFQETTPSTPMFFVLFPGVDPTPWVESLGRTMGMSLEQGTFVNISMGQGQEALAEAVIERFAKCGGWVMLQNCHLMQSWLPKLERLLEVVTASATSNISEGAVNIGPHPSFRCFISAEPPPLANLRNMPESLMQGVIKVANEAPADIKSNMVRAWSNFSQERIDLVGVQQPSTQAEKKHAFQACLFALCWFHSLILGRKRFGPQGWSRAYSFNMGDLTICSNVLQAYIEAAPSGTVPWADLRYILGEVMYGGHITDAWDRRLCNTYLKVLLGPGVFKQMELSPHFRSPIPELMTHEGYLDYIEAHIPFEAPPQFGLHTNAEIGYLTNFASSLLDTVQSIAGSMPGARATDKSPSTSEGRTEDVGNSIVPSPISKSTSTVRHIMKDLLDRLPQDFVLALLEDRAKPWLRSKNGPFVIVALQECARMNTLLGEIRRSLQELDKGFKGQLNMSPTMEDLSRALLSNEWPGRNPFSQCTWEKLAWPSKKSLESQYRDMLRRVRQLQAWVEDLGNLPACLWLPGLFNPTAYLTAIMQVTARQTGHPLDNMTIETHVTTFASPEQLGNDIPPPHEGAYVHGLYIEGARWTPPEEAAETVSVVGNTLVGGNLTDSKLKELLSPLPVLYIRAVPVQPTWEPSSVGYLRNQPDVYECPVYLTSARGPTYIFLATLKTVEPVSKWVLTGTALLMQSDD